MSEDCLLFPIAACPFFIAIKSVIPAAAAISSAAGNAHHTPRIPHILESKNTGSITRNPRRMEIRCAGLGCSEEVKYIDRTILKLSLIHI